MGYRKSFKAGPFRITASKSGLSYSVGVKGARVTKRADGRVQTTVSVSRTGVRYTSTRSRPKTVARRAASRQQVVPKNVPVRSHRTMVAPQFPSATTGTFHFKGYLGTVTLRPDGIQIERSRVGQINGNHSSIIRWEQLKGVDFLDPNIFRNGHVHFVTAADPRGLGPTGHGNRLAAAARNPHAIMFAWHQRRTYKKLRASLSAHPQRVDHGKA